MIRNLRCILPSMAAGACSRGPSITPADCPFEASPPDGSTSASVGGAPPATELLPPAAEFSPPTIEFSPPTAEFSPPTADFSPPTPEFSPPAAEFSPPAAEFSPPAVDFSPPAVEIAPPIVGVAPLAVTFSPPAVTFSPPAVPFWPISFENQRFSTKSTHFGDPGRRPAPFRHFRRPLSRLNSGGLRPLARFRKTTTTTNDRKTE